MKKICYLITLALLVQLSCQSQIAAWDFYGQSFPITCAATTFHSNLVAASGANNITRGPGAPASGGVHSFRTTGFQNNGISTGSDDYFQITLQPAPGYRLSLTTLDAKFNGTSTFYTSPGVTSQFAYSLDGVNFTLIGLPVQSTSLTMAQVSLAAIPELQLVYEGTVVTIRYYASGQTTTGGWGFYSASPGIQGLSVGGAVTEAIIAPPQVQTSGISFTNIGVTQMGVSWIAGSGEKRIVKINTVNSFTDPANGTDPAANPVYGGSGEQVVYNAYGTTLEAITGLVAGTSYWFRVYDYNGSGSLTQFNTSVSTGNPANQSTSGVFLPPTVISPVATEAGVNTAMLGGHVVQDGGSPVTARGTVWAITTPVTINDHNEPEGGADTGFFSHLRTSLPPATEIYFAAYAANIAGSSMTSENSFFTLDTEPTAHVTGLTASTSGTTAIGLSWNPVVSGVDGYLVMQKQGLVPSLAVPSDAIQYLPGDVIGDGSVAIDVSPGTAGNCTITGLSPGTTYAFSIYPYAWDGAHAQTLNYFTAPPVPWVVAATAVPTVTTYHWTGAFGVDWTLPGNWSPVRSVPALNDVLIFDIGGSWTIVNVPTQTIGQLKVLQNTSVTLQGTGTLIVAGDTGEDLEVTGGSQLNLSGVNPLIVSVAQGASGLISGAITFSGGAHRLLALSASGVNFASGGIFKAGSGFTGNPFGTVNLNSIQFNAGSIYICQGGGNPFGATAPASVVVFQPGSLYRLDAYAVPSFGGRTYGNFEMNYPGSVTATGSTAVTIGNFTATQGTFYFNVTGNPGHAIKGNISVSGVATLIFSPSVAGTIVLNGSTPQLISGNGSLMAGSNSTIVAGNSAGITLNMDATLNNLTISNSGLFTIAPFVELTVNGNLVNEAQASGFILESDASLIHYSPGVAGTVKRNIAAATWSDWQDGWHLLSSPVEGQQIGEQGGFVTTGAGNDYDLYAWTEPANVWVNYKNTIQQPDFTTINGGNSFVSGSGYLCAWQQPGMKNFSGTLGLSDVAVENMTITGDAGLNRGWHLLGNPFTSAISWYDGWNSSGIGGVAYIWNEAGMSYTPRNPGEEIPACNGFMVQVTGAAGTVGSLTIPASARIHGSQEWYKESDYPVVRLFAIDQANQAFQECQVRFNPAATKKFDMEFDGRFLPGFAPLFYALWEGEKLAVNSLPANSGVIQIPLYFKKANGSLYRIEAQIKGDLNAAVSLVDKQSGDITNLAVDPYYDFTASDDDLTSRFALNFESKGVIKPPGYTPEVFCNGRYVHVYHSGNAQVEIYGIPGKRLFRCEFYGAGKDKFYLDAPAGCYLVKVITGDQVETTKIMLES